MCAKRSGSSHQYCIEPCRFGTVIIPIKGPSKLRANILSIRPTRVTHTSSSSPTCSTRVPILGEMVEAETSSGHARRIARSQISGLGFSTLSSSLRMHVSRNLSMPKSCKTTPIQNEARNQVHLVSKFHAHHNILRSGTHEHENPSLTLRQEQHLAPLSHRLIIGINLKATTGKI